MNIKKVRPDKTYRGGTYYPINPDKYVGPSPIICRSSWERKYCQYCDTNDAIIKWSSEPFQIPYYNPLTKKEHTYHPDFYIKVKTSSGKLKEYIVELKPKSQTKKPVQPKRVTEQALKNYKYAVETYVRNTVKAKAAKKFAAERNMEYIVLTEDSIK